MISSLRSRSHASSRQKRVRAAPPPTHRPLGLRSKIIFPLSPPPLLFCPGAILPVALTVAFEDKGVEDQHPGPWALETCFWPPLPELVSISPFFTHLCGASIRASAPCVA